MARRSNTRRKKRTQGNNKKCSRHCCGFTWFFLLATTFFIFAVFTWNSRMATNWVDNTQYAAGRCTIDSVANCPSDCQGSAVSGWRCECYVTVSLDVGAIVLPPAWALDAANNPLTVCYGGVSTYSPLTDSWGQSCGTYTTNNRTGWPEDYLAPGAATGDEVECFFNTNADQPNVLLHQAFLLGWFLLVVVLFCVGLVFVAAFAWCCYLWRCRRCCQRRRDDKVGPKDGGGDGRGDDEEDDRDEEEDGDEEDDDEV